jgi:phasin family protein
MPRRNPKPPKGVPATASLGPDAIHDRESKAVSQNPADEMMRMLAEFRIPGMPDMQALADAQKRNLEALSQANKLAIEGAQAIARRNMEILQQTMTDMTQAMQRLTTEGAPQDKMAQQTELMKAAYERAISNMREIADLIQKSNGEALQVLNRRFTEAMDEVKGMMAKNG